MASLQKAQTGNRVYGGVSQSPNRGQVSAQGAQGYIKRELRNRAASGPMRQVGGDGYSDSRSTVAARSLARNKGAFGGQNNGTNARTGNAGGTTDPPNPNPGGNGGGPPAGPPAGGGGNGVVIPEVKVNDAGLLELPYNHDFAMEQWELLGDANEQLLGLKMEGDQQALEYTQGKRQIEQGYQAQKFNTLNTNAAQGTAFSSRYGTAVATNARDYFNQSADLEGQNTAFMQNQLMQRAAIQNNLNQQIQAALLEMGNGLSEEAGGLGFGDTTYEPENNQNLSIYDNNRNWDWNGDGKAWQGNKGGKGSKSGSRGPGTGGRTHKAAAQRWLASRGR